MKSGINKKYIFSILIDFLRFITSNKDLQFIVNFAPGYS